MKNVLQSLTYLYSATDATTLKPSLSEVAFVGRSNVGKSSTLNAICNQTGLARVSKTPGRTRMINVFGAENSGWLVDLPGYGYASGSNVSKEGWKDMIEGYLTSRPTLRCVYMIVDAYVGPTKLDHQMAEWLSSQAIPFRVLVNKIDQVKFSKWKAQQQAIVKALARPMSEISWISAREGTGIPALRQDVSAYLEQRG